MLHSINFLEQQYFCLSFKYMNFTYWLEDFPANMISSVWGDKLYENDWISLQEQFHIV